MRAYFPEVFRENDQTDERDSKRDGVLRGVGEESEIGLVGSRARTDLAEWPAFLRRRSPRQADR